MKLPTATALAVMVMAATGCQTMEQKGYVQNEYGDWIRPGQRYFGDSPGQIKAPWEKARPSGVAYTGPIPNIIPAPTITPFGGTAPVVVTGNAPVTTISPTPYGGTRVVNYGFPDYVPPVRRYPYYEY